MVVVERIYSAWVVESVCVVVGVCLYACVSVVDGRGREAEKKRMHMH